MPEHPPETSKTISSEFIGLKQLHFNIPAVQRGLVWHPRQVVELWDSLSKGYPIGSFLAYRQGSGDDLPKLLDGQQRYNAICMGTGLPEDGVFRKQPRAGQAHGPWRSSQAHLWARLAGEHGELAFMVCTTCHPWGFQNNGDVLPHDEQVKANNAFLGRMDGQDVPLRQLFRKASLSQGYPWVERSSYVPMPLLFTYTDVDTLIRHWPGYDDSLDCPRKLIAELLKSPRLALIRSTAVPVITWSLSTTETQQRENLEELFTRINKGGTQLSSVDQSYSSLCAYCGAEFKAENEAIAGADGGFLPPERLATLAAGLIETDTRRQWVPHVAANQIKHWFTGGDKGRKFLSLYLDEPQAMRSLIAGFRRHCRVACIPSSIYLAQREHWLFTMLWVMKSFPTSFEPDGSTSHFALFCMLPQLMVGANATAAFTDFSARFHEALKELLPQGDRKPGLLTLMALGCAHAALEPRCCMHAYPLPGEAENAKNWPRTLKPEGSRWVDILTKYTGTAANPLLYYYQKCYMNLLLCQSGFNPGMRAHWETPSNRPWDLDHIIPQQWWGAADSAGLRNNIGNMQVLDFAFNRSKGARGIAAGSRPYDKHFLRAEKDGMTARSEPVWSYDMFVAKRDIPGAAGVERRRDHIIRSLLGELGLHSLLCEINRLATPPACLEGLKEEHPLKRSVARFRFLQQVAAALRARKRDAQWAVRHYGWRHKMKNVDPWYCIPAVEEGGQEPDFYHSLSEWLYVGFPVAADDGRHWYFCCIAVAHDGRCEYGLGRGMNIPATEWHSYLHKQGHKMMDDWWLPGPARCKHFRELDAAALAGELCARAASAGRG